MTRKGRGNFFSIWIALVAASAPLLLLGGCSPASFFGGSDDEQLAQQEPYRQVNPECSGIKVSDRNIDAATFFKLVDCFNNDGGLKEISDLVHKLSPDELDSILQITNKYILYDPKTLHEIDLGFQHMSENSSIDEALIQLGKLMENEDFFHSSLALLKSLYFKREGLLAKPTVDTDLLKALEHFAIRVTPDGFSSGLDAALSLADAKSFASLQSKFRGDSPTGRTLESFIDLFLATANSPLPAGKVALMRRLLDKTVSGELFRALDPMIGASESEMRYRIPRVVSVPDNLLAGDSRVLGGLNELFRALDGPTQCMKGSKSVPNGALFVIDELVKRPAANASDYLGRDNPLLLTGLNPFCDYHPVLSRQYSKLLELASTAAMEPASEAVKAFFQAGLARFLVDVIQDPQLMQVAPFGAELRDRGALADLVLLASLPRVEDRASLYEAIRYVLDPIPTLEGRSVHDLLMQAFARVQPLKLYAFVRSLESYLNRDEAMLAPLLTSFRKAFYSDDAHPFVSLVHRFMADATKNQAVLTSLFSISERGDFKDAIKILAKISKNGRLKEIIGTSIALFKPFAEVGDHGVKKTVEPPFVPLRRHDLAAKDLIAFNGSATVASVPLACKQLDFSVPMDQPSSPGYAVQLNAYLGCLNANGAHGATVRAVNFLTAARTEDGRSFWSFSLDLVKTFMGGLGYSQVNFLSDELVASIDDGRIFRILDAIPLFVTRPVLGGATLRPLLDLFPPLLSGESRKSLGRIERYGSKVLRREDFIPLVNHVGDLSEVEPEPITPVDTATYPVDKLKELIKTKECVSSSSGQKRRVDQIIRDYRLAVNSWELVDSQPRYRYSKKEFKEQVDKPLLERIVDPKQSDPKKLALRGMLKVMRYFTLPPGQRPDRNRHFSPQYLMQWLHEKSDDFKPIIYFYPGEKTPRIRLVNSLDRLDLVLLNSDYEAPLIKNNFALQSLGAVAESWGDEPESVWPLEILEKARRTGKKPPTLRETVDNIEKLTELIEIGNPVPDCDRNGLFGIPIPGFDSVKRSLFNTKQVFSIMRESVPRACSTAEIRREECSLNAHGVYEKAGLKVLRNLFFELHYSTPVEYRWEDEFAGDPIACVGHAKKGACAGDRNNLNVILKLVRMGTLRQAGRALKYTDRRDPVSRDFYEGFVWMGASPLLERAVAPLLPHDGKRRLLWGILDQIFDVLNAAEGQDLSSFYTAQLVGKTAEQKQTIMLGWQKELSRAKQMGFTFLAMLQDFGMMDKTIDALIAVFDRFKPWIEANLDGVGKGLRNASLSYFVRALYEDRDPLRENIRDLLRDLIAETSRVTDIVALAKAFSDDPKASKAWDLFKDRLKGVEALPEYQRLGLAELRADLKDFLLERSSTSGNETSRRLRYFLADRMESGDLDQLLILAATRPNDAYGVLEAISHEASTGQFSIFLQLLRRGLSQQNWAWR